MTAIVSFGTVPAEQREEVKKFGLAIYSWDEFLLLVGQQLWILGSFHVKLMKHGAVNHGICVHTCGPWGIKMAIYGQLPSWPYAAS